MWAFSFFLREEIEKKNCVDDKTYDLNKKWAN